MTFSLKAYKKDYKVVVNDVTEGDYANALSEVEEVEVEALVVPEFVGHAFGTNTFTLFFQNGGASIYRYQDFSRIDIQPIPVAKVEPEWEEVSEAEAASISSFH